MIIRKGEEHMKWLIKNGTIASEEKTFLADLLLEDDKIIKIDTNIEDVEAKCIDAEGCYVMPGAVDIHTHMDLDVGIARAIDDFYTGTIAAACGGTTTIIDHMAFGPKGCNLMHQVKEYHKLADHNAVVDYGFHGVFQHVNDDILKEMKKVVKDEGITSFKIYMTYDYKLSDEDIVRVLKQAKEDGILITVHCENDGIVSYFRKKFVGEGKTEVRYHPLSRPNEAEAEAVNRMLYLASAIGDAPVYIVHLSTKEGLEEIRQAKKRGQKHIGVETCPQYLLLTDDLYDDPSEGLKAVMAPPFEAYKITALDKYFVDKTMLIEELIPSIGREQRFLCITRPRRFGKTVMANMVASYFGKAIDSSFVFEHLAIAKSPVYEEYINKYDVIYIDFSRLPENCQTYEEYINRIKTGIKEDLLEEFSELELKEEMSLWDILAKIFQKTNRKFMFIMDEWDAVVHMPFISQKERQEYLLFLKNLLKDQVYVELAYMTGILPIAKYSAASELNMFVEYNMATRERFSSYFGFSEEEIDKLFQIYSETTIRPRITRHDLKIWYDGYCTASGEQLYNPRSIICALSDNQLGSYWTGSGPYDEIFYYIKGNIDEVREDFILMISGEHIEAKVQEYAATAEELTTKNQIYSAMVIYGLLTYEDGEVFIPNRELMYKYNELLLTNESLGYVYRLAKESERMLKATLAGDTQTMAEILEYAHNTESPILSYNNEIELSAIVNLVYLAARGKYRVEREDKAGKGYVDFIFYPEKKNSSAIILELKVDASPEEAIQQIKDKQYILRFKGKLAEKAKYTGEILLVGINYNKETKMHSCKIEKINRNLPRAKETPSVR